LGADFADSRIVEKILVTAPERYEASITTLENTRDLSKITLAELLNALQAQEQRRMMRHESVTEGALVVKNTLDKKGKKKVYKNQPDSSSEQDGTSGKGNQKSQKKNYPPCKHCGKKGHAPFKCWRRPDAKCTKCNQVGHEAVICKQNKNLKKDSCQQQQDESVQEDDQLFVASVTPDICSTNDWLVDSGCTNHMSCDRTLFKELKSTPLIQVRIGNGELLSAQGRGTVAISTSDGIKYLSDVLYVPHIDQNLISVGQLLENDFKIVFEDQHSFIYDQRGRNLFRVKMRGLGGTAKNPERCVKARNRKEQQAA
jgi:hypothetical protein